MEFPLNRRSWAVAQSLRVAIWGDRNPRKLVNCEELEENSTNWKILMLRIQENLVNCRELENCDVYIQRKELTE